MNKQQRAELRNRVAIKNVLLDKPTPAPTAPEPSPGPFRYACGHKVGNPGNCPCCVSANRKAKAAKKAAIHQQKKAAVLNDRGRLPDGSRFDVLYDAPSGTWTGSLVIPGPNSPITLTGSASGVFKLLQQLDEKYRGRPGQPCVPEGGQVG